MVQLLGTTYRLLQRGSGSYQVVRIHDEAVAGWFSCGQTTEFAPDAVELGLLRQIAAVAVRGGKTRWMGRVTALAA
jgi:hypothetical protein